MISRASYLARGRETTLVTAMAAKMTAANTRERSWSAAKRTAKPAIRRGVHRSRANTLRSALGPLCGMIGSRRETLARVPCRRAYRCASMTPSEAPGMRTETQFLGGDSDFAHVVGALAQMDGRRKCACRGDLGGMFVGRGL